MPELHGAEAQAVKITDDTLVVDLVDGRTIAVPLAWFPRLVEGTAKERTHWRLIGKGHGVHWPDLDEDICVEHLLQGYPSRESQRSLQDWLERRTAQKGRNRKKKPASRKTT